MAWPFLEPLVADSLQHSMVCTSATSPPHDRRNLEKRSASTGGNSKHPRYREPSGEQKFEGRGENIDSHLA